MAERSLEGEYGPKSFPPVHPGRILNNDFLIPMDIAPGHLADAIGVDVNLIQAIVNGREPVTAETALLFSRFFGTSARVWTNLQSQYDLDVAESRLGEKLAAVVAYSPEGRH